MPGDVPFAPVLSDDDRLALAPELVDRLGAICLGFPEAHQEQAWVGTRWRIRTNTFAHVLVVEDGRPPSYAREVGSDGPAIVLMFRSSGPELDVLRSAGHPFFAPRWRADEIGLVLDPDAGVDWDEISELLTESYCTVAPKKLAAKVERPEA